MITRFQIVFVFSALLLHTASLGQTSVDSLLHLIEQEEVDSIKLSYYVELIPIEREIDVQKALACGKEALALAERIGDKHSELQIGLHNANTLRAAGNNAKALAELERLEKEAQTENERIILAGAYVAKSRVYESLGEYDKGVSSGLLAASSYAELGDSVGLASALNNLGNNYLALGNLDSAQLCYGKCLKIADLKRDMNSQANSLNNLALVLYRTEDYPKAFDYTVRSCRIYRKMGNLNALATGYMNTAFYCQFVKGKQDSVIHYLLLASELHEQVGNQAGLSACYNALGERYNASGDPEKALTYHHKSLQLAKKSSNKLEEARVLSSIGHDHKNLNERDSAFYYLDAGMKMAKEMSNGHLELRLYDSYIQFNKHFKDFERALNYYYLKEALRDSLYGIEKLKAIEELTTKYDTEKKEQENEILRF